ncbi:MAG: MarR family transcriptional regulator [Firmicutes bacterium]|nr:MarR family transcriptional regulator [Bacillota bacterium]
MDDIIKIIEKKLRYTDWKIRMHGRAILREVYMSKPQFQALQIINDMDGEATCSTLTDIMQLAPSTISTITKKLESEGYIEKNISDDDKRSIKLVIKDDGKDLIDDVIKRRCDFINDALKELDYEDAQNIAKYLSILHDAITKDRLD